MDHVKGLSMMTDEVYRYLNFHEIAEYRQVADKVIPIALAG
jgi:aconitate hydratase 2/2-methylisocitrate dehydratase